MIFPFADDDAMRSFAFPIADARLDRLRTAMKHDLEHGFEGGMLAALVEEWRPEHVRASRAHRTRVAIEAFERRKDKLLAQLTSPLLRAMFARAIAENLPPRDGFVEVPTAIHLAIERGLHGGFFVDAMTEAWLEELAGDEHDLGLSDVLLPAPTSDEAVPLPLVEQAIHFAVGPFVPPLPRTVVPEAMGEYLVPDLGWRVVRGLDGHEPVVVRDRDAC